MSAIPQYPQRHAISATEYMRMTEAGVFAADVRLELMEGEIIEIAPIGSRHAAVVNTLAGFLTRQLDGRAIVSVQNPLILGERSAPQPDLMLLKRREDQYFSAHPTAADVLLIVEVADTTLHFDCNTKIPLYGRSGIPEAWLIDLEARTVHVFRDPDASGYRTSSTKSGGDTVSSLTLSQELLSVSSLFPP